MTFLPAMFFFKIKGIGRNTELESKSYRREFFEGYTKDELALPVAFLKSRPRQRYNDQTLKEVPWPI